MTEDLTIGEIRRAQFWIKRWRAVGGYFQTNGSIVLICAKPPETQQQAGAQELLQDELDADKKKMRHILALVRDVALLNPS